MRFLHSFAWLDGSGGADEEAEVAAYAFLGIQVWLASVGIHGDCLMSSVVAGEGAATATYALALVNLGIYDGAAVEGSHLHDIRHGGADKFGDALHSFVFQESLHAVDHVINYAISVLHDCRRDLYVFAAKGNVVGCIAPCFDSSHAAERNVLKAGEGAQFVNEPQRNWLNGFAGKSAHG